MRVLITGAAGQVGRALQRHAPPQAQIKATTHAQLDISDIMAVTALVAEYQPTVIINAAAYTAVDKAESEPYLAAAINSRGSRNLAEAARGIRGCRLLHISTDYVFDGESEKPYQPDDKPHPLSVYGQTKLLGEQAVLETLPGRAVILRTAWVYAAEGKNFVLTMLRLMREQGKVRVVADQFGTPTTADSIARALWAIAQKKTTPPVLHWTDAGRVSWYYFAVAIAEEGHAAGILPGPVEVTPIGTADYPTPAHRPRYSALDWSATSRVVGFQPATWRDNLRATLAQVR